MSAESSSQPRTELVTFTKPPVSEVALTVQFDRDLVDVDVLAGFTNEVRGDFPGIQRHPVLPAMSESFDAPAASPPPFEIQIDTSVSLPRTWFVSPEGDRLLQLQPDRLALNWRRTDDGAVYPRYQALREELDHHLAVLERIVSDRSDAELRINACEVTYVNPIDFEAEPAGGGHPALSGALNRLSPRPPEAFLPPVEDAQLQSRWRIPGAEIQTDQRPAGRLYLTATPGFRPHTGMPIYILTLVGRVIPADLTPEAAWTGLDIAHKWVVLGFEDLTTPEMHSQWGREDAG